METKKRSHDETLADPAPSTPSQRRLLHRDCNTPPPPPPPPPAGTRDWAALPHDVQCAIFKHLPQADILRGAGLACKAWRRISIGEPKLWRHIDIAAADDEADSNRGAGRMAMARAAVDCSAGLCESFRGPADRYFLAYLATRAPSLKSLHVTSYFDLPEEFADDLVKRLPLLERLVLSRGYVRKAVLRAFLDHCPRLHLLDAGGCSLYDMMGSRLEARFFRTIKEVRLPQQSRGGCGCCVRRAVRYAEEHDY